MPTAVTQTTRPLDEGMEYGDVKRRLRKCRQCQRSFHTYEIHESVFQHLKPEDKLNKLSRRPLLVESSTPPIRSKLLDKKKY